jgi:hypothetical protein
MNEFFNTLVGDPNRTGAIAALANLFVAVVALGTGAAALFVSWDSLRKQHKHNRLSVKPIPFIALADRDDEIRVKLVNYGSGPLIIREVAVFDKTKSLPTLIEWMPPKPASLEWSNLTSATAGRSILPSHEVFLLHLEGGRRDAVFVEFRSACRKQMKKLTVRCVYTDIYGQEFEPYERKLLLFGRPKSADAPHDFTA